MYQTYTVASGDTLWGISNQFGVSVSDLISLNNLGSNTIQINQVLKIPYKEGVNPTNVISYTVKKGDNLYQIAIKYNTTINNILNYNNLKSNNLYIGQVLKIPVSGTTSNTNLPNYTNYIVKKGDSLYSIARNNNISVDTLIKDNSLSSNILQIGQVLKIRTNNENEEILECFGDNYEDTPNDNTITYTVKKGDSLYAIARRFNTTVDSIKKKNNLKSNVLSIGQILKI